MAHVLKSLLLSEGFRQSIFKGQVQGGGRGLQGTRSDRAQYSDWLMMKEQGGVTGVNFISP